MPWDKLLRNFCARATQPSSRRYPYPGRHQQHSHLQLSPNSSSDVEDIASQASVLNTYMVVAVPPDEPTGRTQGSSEDETCKSREQNGAFGKRKDNNYWSTTRRLPSSKADTYVQGKRSI